MSDIYKLQYGATKSLHKYKYFKWVLSGRWNQGSGNSGATATYMEWDELGIGFNNTAVCYGPSYWTFDSYELNGTPWAQDLRMPQVLLGGTWNSESSKFDASNFVQLTVYFHTANNTSILPTSVGLISANNQNDYQSSTPLTFTLYGLNEEINVYEQLISINAANVNKASNATTTITSGFTYHYDTINLNRLTFPGWNGYIGYEKFEPHFEYTTLWETNEPFKNLYSITLSDSIENYDEYIVYGSANRANQFYLDTQNRYVVNHTGVNQGGCFYAGRWNTASTYILINGTEMWLNGTSGYIQSSYFVGQNDNSTNFCDGVYINREEDLHPYKIVGAKEVK